MPIYFTQLCLFFITACALPNHTYLKYLVLVLKFSRITLFSTFHSYFKCPLNISTHQSKLILKPSMSMTSTDPIIRYSVTQLSVPWCPVFSKDNSQYSDHLGASSMIRDSLSLPHCYYLSFKLNHFIYIYFIFNSHYFIPPCTFSVAKLRSPLSAPRTMVWCVASIQLPTSAASELVVTRTHAVPTMS